MHVKGGLVMGQQRISVLHFSNGLVRGGAEEHMLMLLQRLNRERFRLHLACPAELISKLQPELPADIELLPLFFQSPADAPAAFRLARALRGRRIDILHSHMFQASMVASPVGWLSRVPVIVETTHVREHWRKSWKASYWVDRV